MVCFADQREAEAWPGAAENFIVTVVLIAIPWLAWYMPAVLLRDRMQPIACELDHISCDSECIRNDVGTDHCIVYKMRMYAYWKVGTAILPCSRLETNNVYTITCDTSAWQQKFANHKTCFLDPKNTDYISIDMIDIDKTAAFDGPAFIISIILTIFCICWAFMWYSMEGHDSGAPV